LGVMEWGWEVAEYDVNLEIGGTNVAPNDNYPHINIIAVAASSAMKMFN
jgi:hypothetical protein